MIITIKGANFANSNIGTLSTYTVRCNGSGASVSPTSIEKNAEGTQAASNLVATITVDSKYTFNAISSVSVGGTALSTSDYTVSGQKVTIPAAKVTGNVVINVSTTLINTGGDHGGDNGGDNLGGTLITTGSLSGAYLHENSQFDGGTTPTTNIIPDPNNVYFIIRDIPVMGNTKYRLAKGRACWYLNSNKEPLHTKYVNLTSEVTNFEFTTPANCAYLRVAFKYVDIQPSAVTITKYAFGEGVSTYIKDTTAEYRDEYAVEKGKTEPTPYTGYFIWHNIPVTGGNKYQIVNARLSLWYDADKNYVSQVNFNANSVGATTSDWSHVAPDNAAYLTICVNKSDAGKDDIVMVEYPAL